MSNFEKDSLSPLDLMFIHLNVRYNIFLTFIALYIVFTVPATVDKTNKINQKLFVFSHTLDWLTDVDILAIKSELSETLHKVKIFR